MAQYYGNGGGFLSRIPAATKNLLIINTIMFIATMINKNFMIGTFSVFVPASPYFRIWQPITYMFMHGGFWHFFINMYMLMMFGTIVESQLGTKKFLMLYFVSGFGAELLHFLIMGINPSPMALFTPMLGASGALYGVEVAFAFIFPNEMLTLLFPPVSLKAKWMVLIFIGIELITGITGSVEGVAHFAHLGGALFGFLVMLYWKQHGDIRRRY